MSLFDQFSGRADAFAASGPAAGAVLSRFVIPLSVYNSQRRPEHVATGMLLRVDGRHFIVTAGHAVVQTRDQHLWAGFDGIKLQRIPSLGRQASRVNILQVDDLDFGVLPLPESAMGEFVRGEFLDSDSFDLDQLPDPLRPQEPDYLVYGFSAARSQVRVDHRLKTLRQTTFNLRTQALPLSAYAERKADPQRHLLLRHDPKDVLIGGRLRTMPQMRGVSGGAVIHCPPGGKPTLVAMVIEHDKRTRVVVATRIGNVVAFARHMIATSDPSNFA